MYSRGFYIKKLVNDYCVLDIETTGLSWQNDRIIEIGILKVRDHKIIDRYSQLIHPQTRISAFITQLTGISNEMVKNMPCIDDVKKDVLQFIGDDIIIGHNTSFDLNFIANHFQINMENQYMDTVQFSRLVYPQLKHHRLSDMVEYLHLSNNEHRALADCISTYELYEKCKSELAKRKILLK